MVHIQLELYQVFLPLTILVMKKQIPLLTHMLLLILPLNLRAPAHLSHPLPRQRFPTMLNLQQALNYLQHLQRMLIFLQKPGKLLLSQVLMFQPLLPQVEEVVFLSKMLNKLQTLQNLLHIKVKNLLNHLHLIILQNQLNILQCEK